MAVSRKLKNLYMSFFDGVETWAANRISDFQELAYLRKNLDKKAKLTREQKAEIKAFWKPFHRVSPKWALYYSSQNGRFDPAYIPNTLYYTKIDQHFNARKLGYGFNDKNYYSQLFPDIKQPRTLVRKIGPLLFDADYKLIDSKKAFELVSGESEVILKPSRESGSGRGIAFFRNEEADKLKPFFEAPAEDDFIVQAVVKQHPALESIHAGSLNTIRICTLLLDDGVHVLSCVLRMGVDKSRVDNVTAGGLSAEIHSDGTLDKYAHTYYTGARCEKHPQGLVFEGYEVPCFDKVVETVKNAAQKTGNFRLVSWDMAVDEEGDVLLIEANMRKGGINLHQFDKGPLFGELTERVLEEVFGRKGKK